MTAQQHERTGPRKTASPLAAVFLAVAILAVLIPLSRIVAPGAWTIQAIVLVVVILGSGQVAAALRAPAIVADVAELVVAIGGVFAFTLAPSLAYAGGPVESVVALFQDGVHELATGVAPVPATPPISFLTLLTLALLTILLDTVVLQAGVPLIAGILLSALVVLPGLVVPSAEDMLALLVVLAMTAMLMYADQAQRTKHPKNRKPRPAAFFAAASIAVIAIGASVAVAPFLPSGSGAGQLSSLGPATRVDDSIDLGRDLRQPRERRMLTMSTDAAAPPYLRMGTFTGFASGNAWVPDSGGLAQLSWLSSNPDFPEDPAIATSTREARVQLDSVDSELLPVPPRIQSVEGLDRGWRVQTGGRTIRSQSERANDQTYRAEFTEVRPTADQLRTHDPVRSGSTTMADKGMLDMPTDTPASVGRLAKEVTENASTSYDKLIALQDWFRSSAFSYSLDAPVQQGFDGTSMRALDEFLTVREGYCVHFATAFTLMARSEGIPTRIVMGLLPGTPTGEREDGMPVYESSTKDLHAWPESYFEGVGWVSFEPTSSLGVPTRLSEANEPAPEPSATATPTQTPEPTASSSAAEHTPQTEPSSTPGSSSAQRPGSLQWLAWTGGVFVVLALVLTPLVARTLIRRRRMALAADGNALAAWDELQAELRDLGLARSPGETGRMLVARLEQSHNVRQGALVPLLRAIEVSSYAPTANSPGISVSFADELREVRVQLLNSTGRTQRLRAALLPRSLWQKEQTTSPDRGPENSPIPPQDF